MTIKNLNEELAHTSRMINVNDDNSNFDALINSYKRKIAQQGSQIEEQQRIIDSLNGDNHNLKMHMTQVQVGSRVDTGNIEHNLRSELDILNRRIEDLKIENSKYQTMLKSAKSTEKVIVKEHYGNNPYGMSAQEIENLAQRCVTLELELKRMMDSNQSSNIKVY